MEEHECAYMRTGEVRADAEGDWVVATCEVCGSEALWEADADAYAELWAARAELVAA